MAQNKKVNVEINLKDRASTGMQKFKRALLSVKGVIFTGLGLAGLNKLLRGTVGRAQSAEAGLKRLAVAMKSAGRFTTENIGAFEKLAVTLERQTGFIEEDVLEALSILQTFGQMTRDDMEKTIVAATNMATIFNETLTQSAIRLGKAYNGQLVGLQKMGVGISKATFNAKGFSAVLEQLATEQGGQAVARMAGFEGSVKRIGVGFGEAGKEIGKFITGNQLVLDVLNALGGGFNIIAGWLRKIRTGNMEAAGATQEYTERIEAQSKALAELGQQNVFLETSKQLTDVRSRLDDFAEANENVIVSYKNLLKTMSQAEAEALILDLGTDREKKLVEFLKEERQLRIDILRFSADPNIKKTEIETSKGNRQRLKEEEAIKKLRLELAQLREDDLVQLRSWYAEQKELHRNNREALLLIDEIYNLKKNKIEAESLQFFQETLDEELDAHQNTKDKKFQIEQDIVKARIDSDQRISDIENAAAQRRLNLALSVAEKEIAAQQRLVQKLTDMRAGEAAKQLKGDELNVIERKVLMQTLVEEAEKLAKEVADASSAQELETAINALDRFKSGLAGAEDAESLFDAIKKGVDVAVDQIDILGRAKFSPDVDMEGLAIKGKTAGEKLYDEFKKGFEAKQRTNPINFDASSVQTKSSFLDNKG